jgi:hypothetical protein
MTAPANGVPRLMHLVDTRLEQLRLTKQPVTDEEIVNRLLDQLGDEIARTRKDLTALGDRLDRLCTVHSRLVDEFRVDTKLLRDFDDDC